MNRIRQYYALASLTARATIRRPITVLLTVACVLLIGINPLILQHGLGEEGKIARDGALGLQLLLGLFLAAYSACAGQDDEREEGALALLLTKPITPPLLLLARFSGLAAVTLLFALCTTLATLLCERVAARGAGILDGNLGLVDWRTGRWLLLAPGAALALAGLYNHRTGRPFGSAALTLLPLALLGVLLQAGHYDRAGLPAAFDLRLDWRLLPATALITLALLVLTAIAQTLATRLRMAPTLTLCTLILALGLLADPLFTGNGPAYGLQALTGILPNWQHFWMADTLSGTGRIPWAYVGDATLYSGSLLVVILTIGSLTTRSTDGRT